MTLNLDQKIQRAFSMTDTVWQRHANPWSVGTRFAALPLLVLAIWSRVWWGWWALVPTGLAVLWIWLNPRLFPPPRSTDNWASRAVLGERVWLNRSQCPIPRHHTVMVNILNGVSALGLPFVTWGLVVLQPWPTALGMVLVYTGKVWFLDRMVWLYADMYDQNPNYQAWLYRNGEAS